MKDKKNSGKEKQINACINSKSTGIYGCVEELEPSIRGWLINAGSEFEPLSVDIFINEKRSATAYCVTSRPDIESITGKSNNAGFSLPIRALHIPESLNCLENGVKITIEFKVRGNGDVIPTLFDNTITIGELRELGGTKQSRSLSKAEIACVVAPYVEEVRKSETNEPDVKLIAFYLPQYHPIPENDEWWGAGFTEWTNVSQGKPHFPDHYQPHIPGELGFYDLRLPEVREQQAKLARDHGIHGFCYYYYWFNGRKILERPLQEVLESGKPDFPFCICWANETWSRRWDGTEQEVLLKQEHTPESDVAFIRDVISVLKDPRYIRVNGAPLLMVYRASLFPDLRSTAEIWRRICAEEGIPSIHLCIVESFGFCDPYSIGFDSSVQFPPHGIVAEEIDNEIKDISKDFKGKVYDYTSVVENELIAPTTPYKRFPGVMLSWDNTARRKNKSHIFRGSTPELYEVWLRDAISRSSNSLPKGERLVFINAWNEWAEGTHLEPDKKNGRRYLESTLNALRGRLSPEAILKHLECRESLGSVEIRQLAQDLRASLKLHETESTAWERLRKRHEALLAPGTIASEIEPYIIRSIPVVNVATFIVDRINASAANVSRISVHKRNPLYIEGWCINPIQDVDSKTLSYLVFELTDGKLKFYAPVFGRVARPDVAEAHKDLPHSRTLYSGYRAFVDLSELPPEQYRIGLIQISKHSFSLNYSEGTLYVV